MSQAAAGAAIVLCGGPLNPTSVPIGKGGSNAMVPINGKPVIGWIVDDLIAKGIQSAVIVLRRDNARVTDFLARAFGQRIRVAPVFLEKNGTILDSLAAGLRELPADGPVRVVLGDTLIRDSFDADDDFVYAGYVEDSRRWCVVTTDAEGRVTEYADKAALPGSRHLALAGYYHLVDRERIEQAVADAIAAGERELSAALARYGSGRPLAARTVGAWYDFGHIDNCVRAKRELLQSRYFNSLTVDPVLNTITKVSTDNQKLEDELAWYLDIPEELKVLTPRIVSHRHIGGDLEIVQEYYGYPTVAELFVYSGLPADAWRTILRHILRVQEQFRRYPAVLERADVVGMYAGKTEQRLARLCDMDPWWRTQLAEPRVICDGQALRNVGELWPLIEARAEELADSAVPAVLHGDLCFSNILLDFNNQIIRLIDPRGRFGSRGIFGDARYDLAKLRHSARGLYDFIVADMFQIEERDGGVVTSVAAGDIEREVGRQFDCFVREAGYDLRDIQHIEGLLFLSMLPLHHGNRRRQRMMYYTGLRLLNEVL